MHTMGAGGYAALSPQSLKLVGVVWASLDTLNFNIAKFKKTWLSLLCPIGALLLDRNNLGTEPGGLVVGTTAYGAIL